MLQNTVAICLSFAFIGITLLVDQATSHQHGKAGRQSTLYSLDQAFTGQTRPQERPRVHGAWKPSSQVLSFKDFGVSYHQFTGRRNNRTFQAHVWLRLICQQHAVKAQAVTAWTELPYQTGVLLGHMYFPRSMVVGDAPPRIWFHNASVLDATTNAVELQQRTDGDWINRAASLTGEAALAYDATYVLRIEGAENQHEISTSICSPTHPLFEGQHPSWVFASNSGSGSIPKEFPWLVAEHARHHKCMGMNGLILVTTPSRARLLIKHPFILKAMQRQELVLISWAHGYVANMELYYQVPANNIIRLAAWDSKALLGMWDLDEFLVLPKKKTWSDLLNSGCLGTVLARDQEATLPVSWVILPGNASQDVDMLAKHGTVSAALHRLAFKHIPYKTCFVTCKSVIVPSGPWTYVVHGSVNRNALNTLPCDSGRLLHFVSLWRRRTPWYNNGAPQDFDRSLYRVQACDNGSTL